MPDVSNLREDGALPPTFDHVAIVGGDRVEQPGTLYRRDYVYPQEIHNDKKQQYATATESRAADTFAVRAFPLNDLNAHELLQLDPARKIARLMVPAGGQGVFLGTMASTMNYAGKQTATLTTNIALASGLWFLPLYSTNAFNGMFEYTCKAPLWVIACSIADGTPATAAIIQCLVERYDSGTPVT